MPVPRPLTPPSPAPVSPPASAPAGVAHLTEIVHQVSYSFFIHFHAILVILDLIYALTRFCK